MKTVTSKDGTTIAFDRSGEGPPVILVGGAFNTRSFGPNGGLAALLAEHFTVINYDRRGDAVRLFMREGVGLPAMFVTMMRFMPAWSKLKVVAHTVVYDAAIVDDYQKGHPLPAGRWASVTVPTLVAVGGKSPAWMRHAMRALADVLPDARHRTLEGQTHIVKPEALAPALAEFFGGHNGAGQVNEP